MRLYRAFCWLAIALLGCAGAGATGSTDPDVLARALAAGAEAERAHDPQRAFEHYRRAADIVPDDPRLLQKLAQQLSDALFLNPEMPGARERLDEALQYARRSVELDPRAAVNQLSLAILYGRLAGYAGVSERIQYAGLVRRHAEEALVLDSGYAWAHHILGRWHLEMAAIGTGRRALAAVFFGRVPAGTNEEAIRHLERAAELEPEGVAHRVELGIAYERLGRLADARREWTHALELPPVAIHDPPAQQRARQGIGRLDREAD